MANVLNLPTAEQMQDLIEVQRVIAGKSIQDYTSAPGPKTLLKGDTEAGFYGFVQPGDMGKIDGTDDFNGANLALKLGLASGTSFNPDVPLIKSHCKGKTLFSPLTGYRHSISWDAIYNAGIAYDTTDEGFLPPAGRVGTDLFIDSTDNSINCTNQNFLGDKTSGMDYADTVGAVNDTLILKGWSNEDNNTTVTITEITNTKIKVSGATLVSEQGGKKARFYKGSAKVTQGKTISIGTKTYRVYLMKGAGNDPTDSYRDSDRGAEGPDNMWNSLILPLHEHAKIGNWNYPAYAVDANGDIITSDWNIGLTDENLLTHNQYGSGSYTWCQEVQDNTTWRRVYRGIGASFLSSYHSWSVNSNYCWRPVLEAL